MDAPPIVQCIRPQLIGFQRTSIYWLRVCQDYYIIWNHAHEYLYNVCIAFIVQGTSIHPFFFSTYFSLSKGWNICEQFLAPNGWVRSNSLEISSFVRSPEARDDARCWHRVHWWNATTGGRGIRKKITKKIYIYFFFCYLFPCMHA